MPKNIRYAGQRIIILKMVLEIFRTYSAAYFGSDHYGRRSIDILLIAAIAIGQAEGRPMNVSKLAAFAGLPRPTAIRKIKAFTEIGLLESSGGAVTLRTSALNRDARIDALRKVTKLIVDAAAQLSRMNT